MALVLKDRVLETCTSPGTGTVTLLGAVTGYQSFSTIGDGNTCYYTIADQSGASWEVGIGTYSSSAGTLARTTVLSSSSAGALTNFSSGVQNVFLTYPSSRAVNLSSGALTSGRVVYSTTGGSLTDSANLLYSGTDLNVYGITVGRGGGSVSGNLALGASALAGVNTGDANIGIGSSALGLNTSGVGNIGIGLNTLYPNLSGNYNIALGYSASRNNVTGSSNIAIGYEALYTSVGHQRNIAIGTEALRLSNGSDTIVSNNLAIGYQSGSAITTGKNNVIIGPFSGYGLSADGTRYVDVRQSAGSIVLSDGYGFPFLFSTSTGAGNTIIYGALRVTTGIFGGTFAEPGTGGVTTVTPISHFYSITANGVPDAANLIAGELALNTTDGKLFYKDTAGVVQVLANKGTSGGTFAKVTINGVAATGYESFLSTGTTTAYNFATMSNTGSNLRIGIESATAVGLLTGSTNYSGVIGTLTATDFHLGTNSTVRATITSAGNIYTASGVNVGIGVSNPAYKLEVLNTASTPAAATFRTSGFADDNVSTVYLQDDTANALGVGGRIAFRGLNDVGSYTSFATIQGAKENATTGNNAGAMIFKTNPNAGTLTERMRISSSGVVDIGATGLAANANGATGKLVLRKPNEASGNNQITRMLDFAPYYPGFDEAVVKASISSGVDTGTQNGQLGFMVATGGVLYEKIRLLANGNVGIGVTNPSALLEVYGGDIKLRSTSNGANGFLTFVNTSGVVASSIYNYNGLLSLNEQLIINNSTGNVSIGAAASNYRLNIKGGGSVGDSSVYAQFTTLDTGTTVSDGLLIGLGVGSSPIAYINQTENAALVLQTNATERMRITSAGNVGIGLELSAASFANQRLLITASNEGATTYGIFIHNNSFSAGTSRISMSPRYSFNYNTSPYIESVSESTTAAALAFGVTTAGAVYEKMRIDSDGDVGIGTTDPVQKLEVRSAVGNPATSGSTQNGIIRLSNPTDNGVLDIGIRSAGNGAWLQSTDRGAGGMVNQYALLLNPVNGNVGVGTSSPTSKLHVSASVSNTGGTGVEILQVANLQVNTGSSGAAISFVTNEISGTTQYKRAQITGEYDDSSNVNGRLLFATTNISGNLQERMRIDSNGNVGIGESSPSSYGKLAVYGGAANTIVSIKTNSFDGTYYAGLNFSTGGQGANDPQAQIKAVGANNYSANLVFSTQNSGTTNPLAPRMTILSGGNVGINIDTPISKLDVRAPAGEIARFVTKASAGECYILVGADTATSEGLRLTYDNTDGSSTINNVYNASLKFKTNNTLRMILDLNGILAINAYGAGAATFNASGVISSVSDETWKTKDGVPTNTDAMLQKLEPGYWFYNEEKAPTFGQDRQLGFYAQNVHEAIGAEAAPTPEEGKPWGYYDRSVLAIAVMSLKNALNTIEELKQRIETLENK